MLAWDDFFFEPSSRSKFLLAHDPFRETGSHPASKPAPDLTRWAEQAFSGSCASASDLPFHVHHLSRKFHQTKASGAIGETTRSIKDLMFLHRGPAAALVQRARAGRSGHLRCFCPAAGRKKHGLWTIIYSSRPQRSQTGQWRIVHLKLLAGSTACHGPSGVGKSPDPLFFTGTEAPTMFTRTLFAVLVLAGALLALSSTSHAAPGNEGRQVYDPPSWSFAWMSRAEGAVRRARAALRELSLFSRPPQLGTIGALARLWGCRLKAGRRS